MGETLLRRPQGLTLIAILWLIFGLVNIYLSFQTISGDLEVLPLLSDPSVPSWFSFGIPAELALAILVLCVGLFQIITVPGLWTGKPYSYKLALIVPILLVIFNASAVGVYASAPAELNLEWGPGTYLVSVFIGMFWVVVYWKYLCQPHVKAFLRITQPQSTIQEKPVLPKEVNQTKDDAKFYCRYCGAENKTDTVFCEKCGKDLR